MKTWCSNGIFLGECLIWREVTEKSPSPYPTILIFRDLFLESPLQETHDAFRYLTTKQNQKLKPQKILFFELFYLKNYCFHKESYYSPFRVPVCQKKRFFINFKNSGYRNFCRFSKHNQMMVYCPKWSNISLKLPSPPNPTHHFSLKMLIHKNS